MIKLVVDTDVKISFENAFYSVCQECGVYAYGELDRSVCENGRFYCYKCVFNKGLRGRFLGSEKSLFNMYSGCKSCRFFKKCSHRDTHFYYRGCMSWQPAVKYKKSKFLCSDKDFK